MTLWLWAGFLALVGLMLWLDLGVINRRAHRVSARQAVLWTGLCIALALAFNVLVYFMYEQHWFDIGIRIGDDLSGRAAAEQFDEGAVGDGLFGDGDRQQGLAMLADFGPLGRVRLKLT